MNRTLRLAVVYFALLLCSPAFAKTWRVEKDGSGECTIIQGAVDRAAAGDTILIGPGRYEEYSYFFHHLWDVYGCVNVTKGNLVFIGADQATTIVGFPEFTPHQGWSISGFNCIAPLALTIRGITISGLYESIHFEGTEIDVVDCFFRNSRKGVESWGSSRNRIEGCSFSGLNSAIGMLGGSNNTTIGSCTIAPDTESDSIGIVLIQAHSCTIENTTILGGVQGIQAEQFSDVTIRNCHIESGYGSGVSIIDGTTAELYNNFITAEQLVFEYDGEEAFLTATGNIFSGGSYATIQCYLNTMNMHGNHILNGGGYSVEAIAGGPTPIVLDLTDNYWGTSDPAVIAAWILDHNDFDQYEPSHWMIVDYEPFAPHEVETESTTWGAVKSLFR